MIIVIFRMIHSSREHIQYNHIANKHQIILAENIAGAGVTIVRVGEVGTKPTDLSATGRF